MRKGAIFKNVRRRKSGGGDIYIEEAILKAAGAGLGPSLQYSLHPIEGQHAVMVKFRRSRDE